MSHNKMKDIVERLVESETTTGSYTIKNKRSGAYGRYQIMPRTATHYTKKLKIPHYTWKKPHNQDKIFKEILKDNIKSLKKNGHRVDAFTIYGTHQQGAGGFNAIMKNKKLNKSLERNLRANLPKHLKRTHRSKLRGAWINYWKTKMS